MAKKKTAEQGLLFPEADLVINAIFGEAVIIDAKIEKARKRIESIEENLEDLERRRASLSDAIEAVKKAKPKEEKPEIEFRIPSGDALPSLLEPGEAISTSWDKKQYVIEKIEGPFLKVEIPGRDKSIETPPWYKIICAEGVILNYIIAVDGRFLNVFAGRNDEITLLSKEAKLSFKKVEIKEEEVEEEKEEGEIEEEEEEMF